MKFCKIKLLLAALCFLPCFALAGVDVADMTLSDSAALGARKTLGFTSWGEMPFDEVKRMVDDLQRQRQSFELAKMTAEVLSQKTLLGASSFPQKQAKEWLLIRLNALLNLGVYQDVLSFIDVLPAVEITPEILQVKADAFLLADDWENACKVAVQGQTPYLRQMNVMCLALADEKEKALTAFDIWREKNIQDSAFTFAMNKLFDLPVSKMPEGESLSIMEVYLLRALKLSYENDVLPLAYQPFEKKQTSAFQNAVNVEKLIERWNGVNVDVPQQAYKLYLLGAYVDLFRGDLKLIRKRALWKLSLSEQAYSPWTLWLFDKPESQITGDDLLLSLWTLSGKLMSADKAMLLLNKGGFDMETFVSEQIN